MTALLFAAWLAASATQRQCGTIDAQGYKPMPCAAPSDTENFIGFEMLPEVNTKHVQMSGNVNIYERIKVLRSCPEGYRVVIRPENQNFVEVGVWVTLKVECDPERPR